jgi:hypothetical protein
MPCQPLEQVRVFSLFVDFLILRKERFDMQINFKCPHCQASLQLGSDLAGEKGVCPYCSREITVPKQEAATLSDKKEPAKKE